MGKGIEHPQPMDGHVRRRIGRQNFVAPVQGMDIFLVNEKSGSLGPFARSKAHEIQVFSTATYYNDTKIL